ncbi:MAG: hypothetical protein AB7G75_34020 [Candidatus Binatia bacterium]
MGFLSEIRGRDFDSRLFKTPALLDRNDPEACCELFLLLRVHLQRVNPPNNASQFIVHDAYGTRHQCIRWSDAEWATFTSRYERQVNDFWDTKFKLLTPSSYHGLEWPETGAERRRRDVACRFRLLPQSPPRNAAVIPVARVVSETTFFRSHAALYRNPEPNTAPSDRMPGGLDWQFFTSVHDVGHLLGLGHTRENARHCREVPAGLVCYGANLQQQLDVMGMGSMLTLYDAEPWRRRIAQHTHTHPEQWQVTWLS